MFKEAADKIKKWIYSSRPMHWIQTNSLPGFYGVTIYEVLDFIRKETKQSDLVARANSMSFSFFLSLFPLLIVLFTLVPYFPIFKNFNQIIRTSIQELLPGNAGDGLFKFIEDLATRPQSNLLSFGSIMVVFFASNGAMAMIQGFEKIYPDTFEKWNPWHKRLRAVLLTFLLAFILAASVLLIIIGGGLLNWLLNTINIEAKSFQSFLFHALRWLTIILLFYTGISVIYRFAVSAKRRFRYFTPGAAMATILSLLSSYLFSFYVDNLGNYNKLYGSIGTVIAVMIWIQTNAIILLLGFELNASIAINRDKSILKDTVA